MQNKIYLLFAGLKNYLYNKQTHNYLRHLSSLSAENYIKGSEANWLKISDLVQGTRLDHLFFLRRPGTHSTVGLKLTFIFKVIQT